MKYKSDSFTELCNFMVENMRDDASIQDWNGVRECAKSIFTLNRVGQLDASGFIKEFYLKPSDNRL